MAISIYNCWNCNTYIEHTRPTGEWFFWCNEDCYKAYSNRISKNTKKYQQWSDYMAGDGKCPKSMEHLIVKEKKQLENPVNTKPKNKKTKTKKARICSKCGDSGHNARTCNNTSKPSKPKKKNSKRRKYICGNCGLSGHNARTCKR